MTNMPMTKALAQFSLLESPDQSALSVLQLSLLDWLTVAIAGKQEPVAGSVRALAVEEAGKEQSSLVGSPLKVPARMAAMVNGTIGHALDYDDTHFAHIGHPSTVILPAVLAVGQAIGADGKSVQEAGLIGVEASIRVGLWLGRGHYQVGFHQTATAGAFGAALGCARLLGLDEQRTQEVIGLCATRASGLKSQFGTMAKPFNAGMAAANGVEAALLVMHGLQPKVDGLETLQGFGETHHGEADLTALENLGQDWQFSQVSHKFHACCHGLHAALEAFAPLRGRAGEIEEVRVETNPRWLRVCNIAEPRDGLECKFSYAQVLAMAAHNQDTARTESYTEACATDPELKSFRSKVSVFGDDRVSETASRLVVKRMNGSEVVLEHDLASPMSFDERHAKVTEKSRALLGAEMADVLWGKVSGFASPDEIGSVISQ